IKEQVELDQNEKDALIAKSIQWHRLDQLVEESYKIYNERFTQKINTEFSKHMGTYAKPWERALEPAKDKPYLPSWRRNIFAGTFLSIVFAIMAVIGLDKLD